MNIEDANAFMKAYQNIYDVQEDSDSVTEFEESETQENLLEARTPRVTYSYIIDKKTGEKRKVRTYSPAMRAAQQRKDKREAKVHNSGSNEVAGLQQKPGSRWNSSNSVSSSNGETKPKKKTRLPSQAGDMMSKLDGLLKDIQSDMDFSDLVANYLLDEGYAETLDSAEAIVYSMSESWLLDILERVSPSDVKLAKSGMLSKRADELEKDIKSATTKKTSTTPEVKKKKVTRQAYVDMSNQSHQGRTRRR